MIRFRLRCLYTFVWLVRRFSQPRLLGVGPIRLGRGGFVGVRLIRRPRLRWFLCWLGVRRSSRTKYRFLCGFVLLLGQWIEHGSLLRKASNKRNSATARLVAPGFFLRCPTPFL